MNLRPADYDAALSETLMETLTHANTQTQQLLAEADELIARATTFLEQNGLQYPLDEWVTPTEYARRFGLKTPMVVTNWIARGIIQADNVIHIPELNNMRLVRAIVYHD